MKGWFGIAALVLGWAGGLCIAAMMLVTVADFVLRALFNTPIRGTLEIVELFLAAAFFLTLPAVFLRDEHIVVDVVDGAAPPLVPLLRRVALAIGAVVLAVMAWQGWIAAKDTLVFGDVTSDLQIPRIVYWVPVLAGMVLAALAAAAMLFSRGRDS